MNNVKNIEVAIATVCDCFGLDTAEFSRLLEMLGCISTEQKSNILILGAAWAAKDMMENRMKA